jgi:hypothetical protein
MFEKRKQKGSIRKRNVDDVSNGENEDEIDVISTVALVKKEQENRKRSLSIDVLHSLSIHHIVQTVRSCGNI